MEAAGYEPRLSEDYTFPVNPDLNTVANCLDAVTRFADIFVLILGAKYGSIGPGGKSVTNLEYLAAKTKGIPIYTFVLDSIINALPFWKDNPNADFKSQVDSPKLFEFVSEIRDSGERWVYKFERSDQIVDILREQLGNLFSIALETQRVAQGIDGFEKKSASLTARELSLLLAKPKFWQHLLFACALRRELGLLDTLRRDWRYSVSFETGQTLKPKEFTVIVAQKIKEVIRLTKVLKRLMDESLTPAHHNNDAEEIFYSANRIMEVFRRVLLWKLDFETISVDPQIEPLKAIVSQSCDPFVRSFEDYATNLEVKILSLLSGPELEEDVTVTFSLDLSFTSGPAIEEELNRILDLKTAGLLEWG